MLTTGVLRQMKVDAEKIAAMTAWDYFTGVLAETGGVDMVLVGDSLAMTVQGDTDTLAVTLDEMIYHTRLVARACRRPLVIMDMPFMSYQVSSEQALANSGRVMKETKAGGVKIEGGRMMAETVARITGAGIPVVGHIGLTPQAVHQLGGFKAQGKTPAAADALVEDALALQDAGAGALVLECMPAEVAARITEKLTIPTIGIGAGPACDGEIQVTADLLGFGERLPRHAKRYADFKSAGSEAIERYVAEVKVRQFPTSAQSVGGDASRPLRDTLDN